MADVNSTEYWADAKPVTDVKDKAYWTDAQVMDAPHNTVFDQDKDRVVSVPQTCNASETEFLIKRDADQVKNFFGMEDVGGFTALGRGAGAAALSTPQWLGGELKAYGESIQNDNTVISPEARETQDTVRSGIDKVFNLFGVSDASNRFQKVLDEGVFNGDEAVAKADAMIARNKKYMADFGWEKGNLEGINSFLYDAGAGGTSMLASLGFTALTRTPATAGLLFGSIQHSSIYQEARTAGKTPEEAQAIALPAGFMEGALEFVGLDHFIKALKGNTMVKRFINGFGIEATQEASQQTAEEGITQLNGLRQDKPLMQTASDILYNGFLGGVIGGGTNATVGAFVQSSAEKAGIDKPTADAMGAYAEKNFDAAKGNMTEFIDKELAPVAADDKSAQEFMTLMQKFGNDEKIVDRDSLDPETRSVFDHYVEMFNNSKFDTRGVQDVEKMFFDQAVEAGVDKEQASAGAKLVGARADAASRALGVSPMEWFKAKNIQFAGKEQAAANDADLTEAQSIKESFAQKRSIRGFNKNDNVQVQKKLGLKEKPQSVLQFIRSKGGISLGLSNEELSNVKAARKSKGKSASKASMASGELKNIFDGKNGKLSSLLSEKGLGLDELQQLLEEAGYLDRAADADENQAVDKRQEVLDLIEREAQGDKIYPVDVELALADQQDTTAQNFDYLASIGIDDSMTPEEIAAVLRERRAGQQEFVNSIDDEILFQGEHDGDAYFSEKAIAEAKDQNDKSRDILIYMSPDNFINVAMSGHAKEKAERVSGVLKSGEKFSDIPFIGFTHDGEGTAVVTSHEGRHRARALKDLGVKEMPVLFKSRTSDNGNAIRWGSQQKENSDRLRDEWPKKLYAEVGDSSETSRNKGNNIPFPISRSEASTLFQNEKNPRGSVTFGKDHILINMFEGANASTLFHELGHIFLRDMRDIAAVTKRPKVKADYEAVKKWLGVKGDALTVAQEEKFARGFEAYLREGKAPKPELQGVFDAFKKWLEKIYKSVQQLNVNINPEIRKTFDRMLGGDFVQSDTLNQEATARSIEEEYAVAGAMQPEGTFLKDTGDVFRSVHDWAGNAFVPISTRLGNIDEGLKHAVRKFVFQTGLYSHEDHEMVKPFIEKVADTFSPEDYRVFDLALKNRDTVKVDYLADKYGIQEEWGRVREVLDGLYIEARDVGLNINYIEEYFPRQVKRGMAVEYMAAMRGHEAWSEIEHALKEADPENDFTPEEQAAFVNSFLRGFSSNRINLSRPSFTKERTVDHITPEFNKYYEDSMPTLINYIGAMRSSIEARRLFGKAQSDRESNIGTYVLSLVRDGVIEAKQETELKEILKALVEPNGTHGFVGWLKNATYIYTMGSPISAITQIQDLVFSLHKNGYFRTIASLTKSLTGNQVLKKEDLGIENILQEYQENTRASNLVRATFKAVGLTFMDNVGKETYIDATLGRLQATAKKGGAAFDKQMEIIFGDEANAVKADLIAGNMTENVKYLLFSELSDVQPISLAEMPVHYLKGGNWRVMYMLKTYTVKQFDIYRREVFADLASGDPVRTAKGLANFIHLGIALMMMGMSSDALKDFLLGRKIDVTDLMIDNLIKLMGISKFNIYKAKEEGIGNAIFRFLTPPILAPLDDLRDIPKIIKGKKKVKDADLLQRIPLIGKFYYWWAGGGTLKKDKDKSKVFK